MKELRIWLYYTYHSFMLTLTRRSTMVIFLLGKILRVLLFVLFLSYLLSGTKGLGGYTKEQVILFYLSFNLIDTLAQFFFREVYRFRTLIIRGGFDYVLTKPFNPLARVLLGGADFLDFIVLVILMIVVGTYGSMYITTSFLYWSLYVFLVINSLAIAAAFHIFVLGLGVVTTSIDHLVMVYRDLSSMLRIPVDLYIEPIRSALTFVIPLGVMMTFPPKMLMGLLTPEAIVLSILISSLLLTLSLLYWNSCLKHYQSASS